jgi:arylsulfatase A-like enzyme
MEFKMKKLCLIALLCLSITFICCNKLKESNVNVIFITIDALRADHLGCYGYPRQTSPNIDKLAEKGIIFKYAFSHWPKTTPSLAAVFTSTYGYRNGIMGGARNKYLEDWNVTLAEVLKKNGYRTAAVQTNAVLAKETNFNQGFDTYIETWKSDGFKQKDEFPVPLDPNTAQSVTLMTMDWLKKNHNKGKFFLWVHYIDTHATYMPPPPFNTKFIGDEHYNFEHRLRLNPGWLQNHGGIAKRHWARSGGHNVMDYYISQYDGEIAYCDFCLGWLFDLLEKFKLFDNTIIIISADHGEGLGEHGFYFEHEGIHNNCFRVPLIWLIPQKISKKKLIEYPVSLIDIMPMILDFLNIDTDEEMQGSSLLPVITGEKENISKYIILAAGEGTVSILDDTWKLTHLKTPFLINLMGGKEHLLFNYKEDAEERTNLYSEGDNKIEAQERLEHVLSNWQTEAIFEMKKILSRKSEVKYDKKSLERLKSLGYIQ